jgi:hypothetical protein
MLMLAIAVKFHREMHPTVKNNWRFFRTTKKYFPFFSIFVNCPFLQSSPDYSTANHLTGHEDMVARGSWQVSGCCVCEISGGDGGRGARKRKRPRFPISHETNGQNVENR